MDIVFRKYVLTYDTCFCDNIVRPFEAMEWSIDLLQQEFLDILERNEGEFKYYGVRLNAGDFREICTGHVIPPKIYTLEEWFELNLPREEHD